MLNHLVKIRANTHDIANTFVTYCVSIILCSTTALSQITTSPIPEWVVEKPNPTQAQREKHEVSNGSYIMLLDLQSHFSQEMDYHHQVVKIFNDAGVEAYSEFSYQLDTSYTTFQLHEFKVIRGDKIFDKTNDLKFEILHQETELELYKLYSGDVTIYCPLEDIRKGDILIMKYSTIGINPIFGRNRYRFFALQDYNPIDTLSVRVLIPKEELLHYRCQGCKNEVKEETLSNNKVYSYEDSHTDILEFEENMKLGTIPYSYLEFSNNSTWSEVIKWAHDVLYFSTNENSASIANEMEHLVSNNKTTEENILSILNFVQNDIRYLGIEIGLGSHRPFPPHKVLSQRYGDCKDKTMLFISMLGHMNIYTAYPVLVSSSFYREMGNLLPTPYNFDHVICKLELNGVEYYVDPTASLQGGSLANRQMFDFHQVLVVDTTLHLLVDMKSNITDKIVNKENIIIADVDGNGTLSHLITYSGFSADQFRMTLDYYSNKEILKFFTEKFSYQFHGIESISDLTITDLDDENTIIVEGKYAFTNSLHVDSSNMKLYTFKYEPYFLYDFVGHLACDKKMYDIEMNYPLHYTHESTLRYPLPCHVKKDSFDVSNTYIDYTLSLTPDDDKLGSQILYKYETKEPFIKANEYLDFCSDYNTILNKVSLTLSFADITTLDFQNLLKEIEKKKKKND